MQRYAAPIQRRRLAPTVTGNVNLALAGSAPNTDTITEGPANVWAYSATLNAAAANQAAAIVAARTEYTAAGTAYRNANERFLCRPAMENRLQGNAPAAAAAYDTLTAANAIPPIQNPLQPPTPVEKQTYLGNLGYGTVLSPANLDRFRDIGALPLIDPIKLTVIAPYVGGGNPQMEVTIDYTEGQKGYVTRVRDTGTATDASLQQNRPNYAGEHPVMDGRVYRHIGQVQSTQVDTYSNVHHTATNQDMATMVGNLGQNTTKEALEGGVDAITKLVAEGGRFNCVAALGQNLRNDSVFFAAHAGGYRCIEFRDLWRMWTRRFGGRYGVPDLDVTTYLTGVLRANEGMVQNPAQPAATGYNYDVANSQIR